MLGVYVDFSNLITKTLNSLSFSLFTFFAGLLTLITGRCNHNATPRVLRRPDRREDGEEREREGASVGEIRTVMIKLGMDYEVEDEGDEQREFVREDELEELFRDEEPSVEELREVFGVFDEKKDGYIDAVELEKVLSSLGLLNNNKGDGVGEIEKCRKMLKVFDSYGVGLLDFDDFLKFMEMLLC